jgi:hypothetical protein
MAAGATYEPIATTTLGSTAASYTFSSIPGTYTDLIIITNVKSPTTGNMFIQFNGDTATNYSRTVLAGNGTSAVSARNSTIAKIYCDYFGYFNTGFDNTKIIQIQNYSNTTTFKTSLIRSGAAATGTDAIVGLWRSTSAITSIRLDSDGANFSTGSTFTLYGIAAA